VRVATNYCSPLEAEMTKRIALFLLLATVMAVFTVSAGAQAITNVKGIVKDENGKPMVGATIELLNLENGRKATVKTTKIGEYYSMGMPGGNYKISLVAPDGTVIFFLNNVPLRLAIENVYDIDLAKQTALAAKDSGVTEEQRKANEKAKKNNETIKNLNVLLAQAIAQKNDKKYDEAVATMEQAATADQTHDVVFASLADAYLLDKKYPEAETAYNKALALAPPTSKDLGSYHSGLALALLRENKTELGMAECDKTAKLDPSQAGQCYFNEGAILTNQGKPDEANQAFDKAIAADPTRAEAYYQKGVNLLGKATLSKDGKMIPVPGTVEALNKYLEVAPDGRNAQAAKDLLATLGASVQTSFGTQKKSGKK
jgi:tetratricopeptide (TPR) repeat protein